MTRNTLVILVWIQMGLALLVGVGTVYLVRGDANHSATQAASEAVASEFGNHAGSAVRTWFSLGVTFGCAVFVLLVIWLLLSLWCFVSKVAYADSDLMRLANKLPVPESVIPDPAELRIEGD
jgi:hypothetical protein